MKTGNHPDWSPKQVQVNGHPFGLFSKNVRFRLAAFTWFALATSRKPGRKLIAQLYGAEMTSVTQR
jgi:hypothetical protein